MAARDPGRQEGWASPGAIGTYRFRRRRLKARAVGPSGKKTGETLVTRYGFRVPDVIETMVQLAIAQRVEVRMLEGRDGDSPNRCQLPFWSLARAR